MAFQCLAPARSIAWTVDEPLEEASSEGESSVGGDTPLVGADGATHAGAFDIAYLGCLPNFVLMAPSSIEELEAMVSFAADYNDGPIALRYPRGEGVYEESLLNATRSKPQVCSQINNT